MGIDVGGTFTDFVLLDRHDGRLHYHKEPSTPSDPAAAIAHGAAAIIAQAGTTPDAVELVVHGTTISLNAILQRKGARIALVVSPGNRDILEIARVRMTDSYDFFARPETPLAPRDRVVEIRARIDSAGAIVEAPTADDFDDIAHQLALMNVDAVAVVLLNSYANEGFERAVAAALAKRLTIPVTASTEVWSEIREYERAMIGAMNAYVTPVIHRYYDRLADNLRGQGIVAPLSITTSNGGSVDIRTAYERPIDSTLSGPASGVVAAIETARATGIADIVTFDMGGTSADIAIAVGDAPEITTRSALGEIPLILPVVNVGAIGAGGGSIIRVDESGFLKVGPASAGAVPGPACFDKGGTQATTTDCYLLCGFLDPARFAGGQIPLSVDRARAALDVVAQGLGYEGGDRAERAADAALRVASSMMATEVRKALARRGSDPADFVLVPYGGAGPTHAALLAEQAGLDRILVASRPGIFCALGAAVANLRRDFVRTCRLTIGRDDAASRAGLDATLAEMRAAGDVWSRDLGDRADRWRYELSADMRYPDQAFDLTVSLADVDAVADVADALAARFHADHLRLYGFDAPDSDVEISRVVLSVIGVLPHATIRAVAEVGAAALPSRPVFINGARHDAAVIDRASIAPGDKVEGPAIIEQADTTTVVPPGWSAQRLADDSLMITRQAAEPRAEASDGLDPIQLELLYHKFKATTEEMGIALGRTARSSYVRETHDFATALCSTAGRFFAYPAETGIALGIDQDCSALIAAMLDLSPGDVIATNHPYLAPGVGSHLPDINLLQPYFHDGEIVCFGWSFAHCADIGGGVPSSISPSFDNLFQEGLAIPPMKMVEKGEPSAAFMALLRANSRIPDIIVGDLQAQLAALAVGERRVVELIRQHGRDTFLAAQAGLVDYAKQRARRVTRAIPDGVYEFADYLDDDYRSKIPVRFRCRMEVTDGCIHLDLTGTDPQLAAPYNVPTGGVRHPYLTSKIMHLLLTYDRELPLNHGLFENVTVSVPKGSVMNPEMPAPVGIRHAGAIRFNDAVQGCLTLADASVAPAASAGTVIPVVVAQTDLVSGRARVSVVQSIAGGAGATHRGDGSEGRDRSLANISNTPVERSEIEADIRIEHYGLRTDSGGAGTFRGGNGVILSIRVLGEGLEIMGRGLERFVFQPWGLFGGRPGAVSRVVLNLGGPDEVDLGKIDRVRPKPGDLVTIMTPGGGGHGDPFARDVELVATDVRLGFVSHDAAEIAYGVVLDESGAVDDDATAQRRAAARVAPDDGGFGAARAAWEAVFDDAAMTRMATALLRAPAGIRVRVREGVFEQIVPGIAAGGAALVMAPGFDEAAARARLGDALVDLEARWPKAVGP